MRYSLPNDGLPSPRLLRYKLPDDTLNDIGKKNARLLAAIISCALIWVVGAMQLMSSAFTAIDCRKQNCSMVTLVEEFELYGNSSHLAEWSTSFFMAGNMVGGATLTHAADRFGRRPILLLCTAIEALLAIGESLSPNIVLFATGRFFHGMFYIAGAMISWVTAYEHTPTALRSFTTLIFGFSWVLGYCLVTPIAYISPSWRYIVGLCGLPLIVLFFVIYCFTPETLHFLVKKRKREEIVAWLEKIDPSRKGDVESLLAEDPANAKKTSKSTMFRFFIDNKEFIVYGLIQAYLWTTDVFSYFGLSLYSTQLAGNIYINYLFMGIVEIPVYLVTPYILERFGRRLVVSASNGIAAAFFLANLLNPTAHYWNLFCWVVGKLAISTSFMALVVYSSELFPTSIRNFSVGLCSTISRLGGVFAPQVTVLGTITPSLPIVVLSIMSVIASLLTLFLPETHGKPLPARLHGEGAPAH